MKGTVHKSKNFFVSDFEFCTISLLPIVVGFLSGIFSPDRDDF
jgi:hypothetical protein